MVIVQLSGKHWLAHSSHVVSNCWTLFTWWRQLWPSIISSLWQTQEKPSKLKLTELKWKETIMLCIFVTCIHWSWIMVFSSYGLLKQCFSKQGPWSIAMGSGRVFLVTVVTSGKIATHYIYYTFLWLLGLVCLGTWIEWV